MSDIRMWVQFENGETGFVRGKSYEVLAIQDGKFLLVNDEPRFVWVEAGRPVPALVLRGSDRLFDLQVLRLRQRLEDLAGKRVVLSTWEHLGFDPDEVNEEQMFLYRGTIDGYDGETLFLLHQGDPEKRFGILPKAIASIEELG